MEHRYDDDIYDDIDEAGTFDYGDGDDRFDNYEEIDDIFCDDDDDDTNNDCDYDESEDKLSPAVQNAIFSTKELNTKAFAGDFDLSIAEDLYYGEATESSQIKAIEYAEYFAKLNVAEAKDFVIDVIQNYESNMSKEVTDRALAAFVMFFRNYVRKTVEDFYNARPYTDPTKRFEDIQDAMAFCWMYILNDIDRYDYNLAKLTTYFKSRIYDAISNYEAKKRFRASKTTMRVDKIVSKAQTELREQGIEPTIRAISMYCRQNDKTKSLTPEQIGLSMARLLAENTMSRIDADNNNIANRKEQERFVNPEDLMVEMERTSELIEAFRNLTENEQKVCELRHGLKIFVDDGEIIDTDREYSFNEIAGQLNITAIESRQLYFSACRKLKNIITQQSTNKEPEVKKDKLLRNRSLTFSKSQDDEDLLTIIDSITSITDSGNNPESESFSEQ